METQRDDAGRKDGVTEPKPIRPHFLAAMEAMVQPLCKTIDAVVPEGTGFAVMLFRFDGSELTYGSNAKREDMIKALREQANQLEARQDWQSKPENN